MAPEKTGGQPDSSGCSLVYPGLASDLTTPIPLKDHTLWWTSSTSVLAMLCGLRPTITGGIILGVCLQSHPEPQGTSAAEPQKSTGTMGLSSVLETVTMEGPGKDASFSLKCCSFSHSPSTGDLKRAFTSFLVPAPSSLPTKDKGL